jgi:hypothetical protein
MVPTVPDASLPEMHRVTSFTRLFTVPDLHPGQFPFPVMMV